MSNSHSIRTVVCVNRDLYGVLRLELVAIHRNKMSSVPISALVCEGIDTNYTKTICMFFTTIHDRVKRVIWGASLRISDMLRSVREQLASIKSSDRVSDRWRPSGPGRRTTLDVSNRVEQFMLKNRVLCS